MTFRWQSRDPWQSFTLMTTPTWNPIAAFRFRNDDGSQTAASWIDSQNVNVDHPEGVNFRLRCLTQMTNSGDTTSPTLVLQFRVDGGTWTTVTGATAVRWSSSPHVVNGALTTQQLTGGSGTFINGLFRDAANAIQVVSMTAGSHTECEWCLQAVDLEADQEVEFRILINDTDHAGGSTWVPKLTVQSFMPAVAPTLLSPGDQSVDDGTEFTWGFNTYNQEAGQAKFAFRAAKEVGYPAQWTPDESLSYDPASFSIRGANNDVSGNGLWLVSALSPGVSPDQVYYQVWDRSDGSLLSGLFVPTTSTQPGQIVSPRFCGKYLVLLMRVSTAIDEVDRHFVALDAEHDFSIAGAGSELPGTGLHVEALGVSPTELKGVAGREGESAFVRFDIPGFDNRVIMSLPGRVTDFHYSSDGSKLFVAHRHSSGGTQSLLRVYDTLDWSHTTINVVGDSNASIFHMGYWDGILAIANSGTPAINVFDISNPSSPSTLTLPSVLDGKLGGRPVWDNLGRVLYFPYRVGTSDFGRIAIMRVVAGELELVDDVEGIQLNNNTGRVLVDPSDDQVIEIHQAATQWERWNVENLLSRWWDGTEWAYEETFIESSFETLTLPAGAFEGFGE